jgi:antitoxin component of RelBE/YafQ-DinJ toxin-antitoxin module
MSKTAMARARIQPDLKARVKDILASLGLNATLAIILFHMQV